MMRRVVWILAAGMLAAVCAAPAGAAGAGGAAGASAAAPAAKGGAPDAAAPAAAGPLRLTLDEAVQRALSQGEEMRSARAKVRQADGQVTQAASQAFPQITGSVGYSRQLESIYAGMAGGDTSVSNLFKDTPFGAANSWTATLQVQQLLFSGGKVGAGITAARAYRSAAREQEKETASDVVLQVKQAYLDAALAGRLAEIADTSLALARDQLRQVRLYKEQGSRAEYDLLRAEVDAANQEPGAVSARNGYQLALLSLKRMVHLPPDQELELATPLQSEDATIPVPVADVTDASARPALRAAEENVTVQQQAVSAALADRWPQLSANATFSDLAFPQKFVPNANQFSRNWSAGFTLSFPIFVGFRTGGAAESARAQLQQVEADRDLLRENVRLEVEQARVGLQNARTLLAARRETVRSARRAYELAQVRFRNGMATQLEVSDARLQMQSAQVNEVQVTRDYLVALAQLERAVGRTLPVAMRPLEQLNGPAREEGK